ncbi:hypothetical protein [Xanthomonas sp. LMG 12460]|uniref:hypothetical protein n=1 Tax=Xanthomonas sp. LMG 12460 TaxID=1591132 RepID=UPI00186B0EE6|nr:hypothetical protein [Xanthomonas sp. LMG 12460]
MELANSKLLGFGVYRDGGSLSLSFRTADGTECELTFKVNLAPPAYKPNGYVRALLYEYTLTSRADPITGMTGCGEKVEHRSITWQEAAILLKYFQPQVSVLSTEYSWVYPEMVRAADLNGLAE